jgi:acyl carrier protein
MNMDRRLAELLAGVFGMSVSEIQLNLQKADVDNWDSLKQMDLVVTLEREYGIQLEITDIVRMISVGDIMAVLQEKGINLES